MTKSPTASRQNDKTLFSINNYKYSQHTMTCVTDLSDVQMCGLVADGIVDHTAVGVFILIFHLQR